MTTCFRFLFGLIFLCSATPVFSQANLEWPEIFKNINQEVLNNSKAYSSLQTATATIGHRLTGSENGKKAEQFAFDLLQSYGFKDVRFQPFEVESWSRKTNSLAIGPTKKQLTDVKSVALAYSPVKANITAEIIDMGNGLESDYLANPGKVKNKIAFVYLGILPGSDASAKNLHRSEKTALAIQYGAAGIIFFNTADNGVLLTGTASVTGKIISIPAVCMGKEAGFEIKKELSNTKQYAHIQMSNFSGIISARNIITTVPGRTLPNEKIVVGGHLDSWDLATGAIDNGIGSFSVMDMARTFMALKLSPQRTVEFVLFMGEEEGLLGSKAYVKQALANNTADQVRFMLNYDMANDPKGFAAATPESKELFEAIGAIAQSLDTSFKNSFNSGAGLHSDHQPFMLEGIPTGGPGGGSLPKNSGPCYHADCDDFSLVDEKGLQNTIRFNAMLVYGIADAATIPSKRLDDSATRDLMLKSNLKEPLKLAGEWRWQD